MSGNVVAWVFDHYPVETGVDRNRKLVLSEVAEAANREFENAHPGVAKIAAHWGFDKGTVRRHLKALCADGWLEETEAGGGRGNATVYRVCVERGAPSTPLPEGNARIPEAKRAHSSAETRAIPPSSHTSHPGSNSPLDNTRAEPAQLAVEILDGTDPVQQVFEAWRVATDHSARTKLDAPRRKAIVAAFALGFEVDELVDAVRGWRHSPHHRGENERHTVYNRLPLLLRDADQIEMFRDLERRDARTRPTVSDPAVEAVKRMREMEGRD